MSIITTETNRMAWILNRLFHFRKIQYGDVHLERDHPRLRFFSGHCVRSNKCMKMPNTSFERRDCEVLDIFNFNQDIRAFTLNLMLYFRHFISFIHKIAAIESRRVGPSDVIVNSSDWSKSMSIISIRHLHAKYE